MKRGDWFAVVFLAPFACCIWGIVISAWRAGELGGRHSTISSSSPFYPFLMIGLVVLAGLLTVLLVKALLQRQDDEEER